MKDFYDFLKRMGGMHDSTVACLTWLPSERRVEFHFDDLYSNFDGLPEYPGREPGMIALHGVSNLTIALENDGPLRVFEFLPQEDESDVVLVTFSPSGKIRARFCAADYPPCRLVTDS
ncbi:hypothetical protein SDC9_190066 [bioreactor metagenome]|uniref:Uncharacterized protein n=2 Tax=root TaxID=1 RepID=A0A323UQ71_9RHOO|nr:hypothetical protein [Parazoarcus communis]NMG72011.1 hypothetical protein [Parazoarcus communis SWub3 = DSM 12120]PZA14579.1 hypothetical protein DNK49_21245 [Azoarcus communis] [Parazoarcus communis SWub3 = DSM 12120]